MIKLKNKNTGELYDLPHEHLGGLIMYDMTNVPKVFFLSTISINPANGVYTFRTPFLVNGEFEFVESEGEIIIPPPPPVGTVAVQHDVGMMLHVWGSGGQSGFPAKFRTHNNERYGLSQPQFAKQRPFYAYDIDPILVEIDKYENGKFVRNPETNEIESVLKTVNLDFQMDEKVMDEVFNRIIDAKLQGMAMLYYANDAPLSIWRRTYKDMANKRGTKVCWGVGSLGDGATREESIIEFANDLKQSWYAKAKGLPIIYALITTYGQGAMDEMARHEATVRDILKTAGIPQAYTVLMSSAEDIGAYTGGTNFWNASSSYYTYREYGDGFQAVPPYFEGLLANNKYKIAPMISFGLDSRARRLIEWGNTDCGFYPFGDVLNYLPQMVRSLDTYRNEGNCAVCFVGHADETNEQGEGVLDLRCIDILKNNIR